MIEDAELLRRYAATRAEGDFAELVRRHLNLVYSAALRQVNGDAHLAQDVTQVVFADLARKVAAVAHHRVLAGWLFTSTRFAAAKAVRGERRRQVRETEAQLMQELFHPDPDDPAARLDWARVRPVLDDVLGELSDGDREAILLRFFDGRDFAAVGKILDVNDNTARMRVERALDKLRALLERRGVTSTSAALATVLANQAVVAAPAGLVATVTGAALAGVGATATGAVGVTAGAGAGALATFMSMTKLQLGITSALAVAGATGFVMQANANAALRNEVAGLRQENAAIATLQAENLKLARTAAEVADMRGDDAELARLGDESTKLQARLQQVARAEAARAAALPDTVIYEPSKLDRQPRPISQARPQYPFELRRAGIGGEAVVDFVVNERGEVVSARAVRSALGGAPASTDVVKLEQFTVASNAANPASAATGLPVADMTKLIEAAAVAAVSQWKFAPGQKGGRAVGTHMQVPIVFTLNNK